jgi:hypothetical protein
LNTEVPSSEFAVRPTDYVTLNFVVLVTEPPVVVTAILSVFAPVGTFTFRFVAVSFVKVVDVTVTFLR